MPATVRLVTRSAVRLGRTRSSWIALEKLMSFLGLRFPLEGVGCRNVSRAAVSGLDAMRARVCDARFLSLPAMTESRSSATMQLLSSITRTESFSCTASNEMRQYAAIRYPAEPPFLYTNAAFRRLTRVAQANEFTIIPVNVFIPALRPCATKDNCVDSGVSCLSGTGCKVAVPYSFDSTPWANIPAVATDRYAFWITNPSMAMYEAMNLWCNGKQGQLAFPAESSYSSIQVWRFDPYQYCPLDAVGQRKCPQDTSATFRNLPGFISTQDESVCTQRFNVLAPTISYIDENNLAITVMETTFQNLNVLTLRPVNASLARLVLLSNAPTGMVPPPLFSLVCAQPCRIFDSRRSPGRQTPANPKVTM